MLTSLPIFTLLCLLSVVQAKVVRNFKECSEYFYKGQEPKLGVSGTHICQRLENSSHFATLYDTHHRIPVYSAYIFQPGNGLGRPSKWFVEPQLVNRTWSPEMRYQTDYKNKTLLGMNQAIDEDYKNLDNVIHRGHLNPYSHNIDDSAIATFTLTNAVPQVGKVNVGAWRVHEKYLYNVFKSACASKAYVVVGAIPSANNTINARVNVPDYLWTAYCCLDNNKKPLSGAAWAKNEIGANVVEHSLDELVEFLESKFPAVGAIFKENCKKGKVDEMQ